MGFFSKLRGAQEGADEGGAGDDVARLLSVLRDEIVANERDHGGLLNRPRYMKAVAALKKKAPAAVPQLLDVLDRPIDMSDEIGHAVCEEVVEVLGTTGDPRAIERLTELLGEPLASVPIALAATDLGTEAMLTASSAGGDKYIVRVNAVQGLGVSKFRQQQALHAIETALQDESPHVRHAAAMALINRPGRSATTLEALRAVAENDSQEWVRNMAEKALR